MKRKLIVLGPATLLFCLTLSAVDDQSELKRHSDAHSMFLLRDALSRYRSSTEFYAAEVACAFNDVALCEEKFKSVLADQPKPSDAKQIHDILANVAMREGRYKRCLQEIDALLAVAPSDMDATTTRPFIEVLSRSPDQAVRDAGNGKANLHMEDGKLPLLINGKKASYFFDTGANLSTVSESEAARFAMDVQEAKGGVSGDVHGRMVSYRIAVAKSLSLGSIELRNVAFLVSSDEQQPFVDMEPGQRGLIGMPVLLALGSITWTREGTFEADRSPAAANPRAANIFFDGLNLIIRARFERHALPFVLDTGASASELWPKFAGIARDLIRKSGTRQLGTVIGMGGGQKSEVMSIPKVVLELGGKSVAIEPAQVLETQQRPESQWFYGNLGIDLLRQAQSVAINFKTMTLTLEDDGRRTH
jgi:Aspartyl protease